MEKDIKEMKQDIKEIKEAVVENKVHLAQYNILLDQHIKRTTLLEERVEPIDTHVKFVSAFLKFSGSVGVILLANFLLRLWFNK